MKFEKLQLLDIFLEKFLGQRSFLLIEVEDCQVTLTSEHYQRSPLVQGGMEIGCKVTASIPGTCINILILKKYQDIIEENYTEPKEDAILGSCLVPNDASG